MNRKIGSEKRKTMYPPTMCSNCPYDVERNSNDNEHLTQQQQQKYSTGNDSSAYIFVPSSLRRLNSNGCQKERKELHFLGYSSRQNRKKDIKPETISPKIKKKTKEKKDQKMKRKMIRKKQNKKKTIKKE